MKTNQEKIAEAQTHIKHAKEWWEQKKYPLVIELCDKAIECDPTNADYYDVRGCAASLMNDHEQAFEDFTKAIERSKNALNPLNKKTVAEYYFHRAVENSSHDSALAITDYTKAIELNPKDLYYSKRGDLFNLLSNYAQAIADYTKAINIIWKFNWDSKNYAACCGKRGDLYCQQEKFKLAMADYSSSCSCASSSDTKIYFNNKYNIAYYSDKIKSHPNNKNGSYKKQIGNEFVTEKCLVYLIDTNKIDNNVDLKILNQQLKKNFTQKNEQLKKSLLQITESFKKVFKDKNITIYLKNGNDDAFEVVTEITVDKSSPTAKIVIGKSGIINALGLENEKEELVQNNCCPLAFYKYHKKASYYKNRGNARYCLKEFKAAVEDFDEAIKIDCKDAESYNGRGNAYYFLGADKKQTGSSEYKQAADDFQKATELDHDGDALHHNLGNAYCALKDYRKAIEAYDAAIKLNRNDDAHYIRRGNAYYFLKEYQPAVEDFNRAIKLNPKNASYYSNRCKANYFLKKYPAAIDDANKATKLNPKYARFHIYRGLSYYQQAKCEEAKHEKAKYAEAMNKAINDLTKAIDSGIIESIAPADRIASFYACGNKLLEQQQLDKAAKFYQVVLHTDPNHAEANKKLSLINGGLNNNHHQSNININQEHKPSILLNLQDGYDAKKILENLKNGTSIQQNNSQESREKQQPTNNTTDNHRSEVININKNNGSYKKQVSNSDAIYIRHPVLGDGDCGYTAFGITRDNAYGLITQRLNDVRDILKPVVEETLLTEDFISYLKTRFTGNEQKIKGLLSAFENYQQEAKQGKGKVDEAISELKKFANDLAIISAYIDYDVRDKKIDAGWSHPAILHVLAEIQKIELHIWELGENNKLIPHTRGYASHKPKDVNQSQRSDILFVDGNHFDRLELSEHRDNVDYYPIVFYKSHNLINESCKNIQQNECLILEDSNNNINNNPQVELDDILKKEQQAYLNKLVQKGDTWRQKRQYDKAIKCYEEALKVDVHFDAAIKEKHFALERKRIENKTNNEIYSSINSIKEAADNFKKIGDYHKAVEKYGEILEVLNRQYSESKTYCPVWKEVLVQKGDMLRFLQQYSNAFNCYTEAFVIDSNYVPALQGRQITESDKQREDKINKEIEAQTAKIKKDADTLKAEAKYKEAITEYEKVLAILEQYPNSKFYCTTWKEVYTQKAEIWLILEKYSQSAIYVKKALKIDKHHEPAKMLDKKLQEERSKGKIQKISPTEVDLNIYKVCLFSDDKITEEELINKFNNPKLFKLFFNSFKAVPAILKIKRAQPENSKSPFQFYICGKLSNGHRQICVLPENSSSLPEKYLIDLFNKFDVTQGKQQIIEAKDVDKQLYDIIQGSDYYPNLLGIGGFGFVQEVMWIPEKITIVKKKLRDTTISRYIKEEAKNMTLCGNHPRIVKCYGISDKSVPHSFFMEKMRGGNLLDLLKNKTKKLTWKERWRFAKEIIEGLQHLHSKKIAHRDLKSENILLNSKQHIKLSDFGLSKNSDEIKTFLTSLTYSGNLFGTFPYMAPELFDTKKTLDLSQLFKTDIYSFGVVLWEIVARKQAVDGFKSAKTIRKIPTDCPQSLRELITKCWSQKPEERLAADAIMEILKKNETEICNYDSSRKEWSLFPAHKSPTTNNQLPNNVDNNFVARLPHF